MHQIDQSDKQKRNPQEKKGVVAHHVPAVPHQNEHAPGHHNGEDFGEAVKEEKVVTAEQKQAGQQDECGAKSKGRFGSPKTLGCFGHITIDGGTLGAWNRIGDLSPARGIHFVSSLVSGRTMKIHTINPYGVFTTKTECYGLMVLK